MNFKLILNTVANWYHIIFVLFSLTKHKENTAEQSAQLCQINQIQKHWHPHKWWKPRRHDKCDTRPSIGTQQQQLVCEEQEPTWRGDNGGFNEPFWCFNPKVAANKHEVKFETFPTEEILILIFDFIDQSMCSKFSSPPPRQTSQTTN